MTFNLQRNLNYLFFMKKTIKLSRASFPGVGNFSWMNYFVNILNKKYNVV